MHDPQTVAFDIYLGRKQKKNGHYRTPLVTIWHVDPEKDGTDDSCGWFMRSRHGSPEMIKKIRSAIDFDFDRTFKSDSGSTYYVGYFTPDSGMPVMSVQGIVLNMFSVASWEFFNHNRKKQKKWMQNNLFDILHFAENPIDSLNNDILGTFRIANGEKWNRDDALNGYVSAIYGWLLRSNRKWYHHPKWHIWHWKLQIHPIQQIKRRYWDKCSVCGKRGFKGSAIGDWGGKKIWHQECDTSAKTVAI